MKKYLSVLLASAVIGLAAMPAEAALVNRGGGLIYDTDLNVTWLQDANYAMTSGYDADGLMTEYDASAWAYDLVYGGYSDWRLPTVEPQNYSWGYDGSTGSGYNITTGSEMGHLFYTELGNLGFYDTNGVIQPGWGLTNVGPFINLQSYQYWTDTVATSNPAYFWYSDFQYGYQDWQHRLNSCYAMAVRPGDSVVTPEPGTLLLMGSGLLGLGGFVAARRRFSRRNG